MMELCRIASHLVAIGTGGMEIGALTVMTIGFREREMILDFFEALTGLRMNHAYIRPGGVANDLPENGLSQLRDVIAWLEEHLPEYATFCNENPIFKGRMMGIGHQDLSACMALGVTGPVLRSTGYAWDLRKQQPYCGYETYDFDVCAWHGGTANRQWPSSDGRFRVRLDEMWESLKIVKQCATASRRPSGSPSWSPTRRSPGPPSLRSARRPGQQPRAHQGHHGRVHGGPDPPLQARHRGLQGSGGQAYVPIESPQGRTRLPRRLRRWHPPLPRPHAGPRVQPPAVHPDPCARAA
jgi:NADH-quinone oxidoreductase subunit D